MNKGLEALKDLENHFKTSSWAKETDFTMICFEIEKELKALKIIKDNLHKFGDAYEVLRYSKETDDYIFLDFRVSKEEYDLLKEILL